MYMHGIWRLSNTRTDVICNINRHYNQCQTILVCYSAQYAALLFQLPMTCPRNSHTFEITTRTTTSTSTTSKTI